MNPYLMTSMPTHGSDIPDLWLSPWQGQIDSPNNAPVLLLQAACSRSHNFSYIHTYIVGATVCVYLCRCLQLIRQILKTLNRSTIPN